MMVVASLRAISEVETGGMRSSKEDGVRFRKNPSVWLLFRRRGMCVCVGAALSVASMEFDRTTCDDCRQHSMQALRLCLAADHLVDEERLLAVLAVALDVSERLLTEPGWGSSSLKASTMLNEADS